MTPVAAIKGPAHRRTVSALPALQQKGKRQSYDGAPVIIPKKLDRGRAGLELAKVTEICPELTLLRT